MTYRQVVRSPFRLAHEHRHTTGQFSSVATAVALCASLFLVLASCSAQGAPPPTTTTSTTSTTTTTAPVAIAGSSILRARVAPLSPGEVALPPVFEGSAAWLRMVPIAYRSFGSGPDLLLVSGQDGTLSWWGQSLLSDLSGHYRVTVFDLPGVGYSGRATAPLSLSWLADMTAGFALTVGLSDPIVLGWGLGGEIALSLVERHPGFASSLVLVDTTSAGSGTVRPSKSVARLLARPSATPVALSTVLFPATPAGLQARLAWQSSVLSGTTDWMTAPAIEAEGALQASIWKRAPLTAGLSGVTIPALVVSGADDVVFPSEDATRLADELPQATAVVFPDCGYGALIQDAPEFVAAVEKFTGSNASSSTTTSSTSTTTTTSPVSSSTS